MSTLSARFEHFDDRFSPVVVKEMRQALRDGTTVAILIGFLVAMVITLAVSSITISHHGGKLDEGTGRATAGAMMMLLVCVATLALPVQTAVRIHFESASDQLGMLMVTRVSFHGIFWGKVWVTMIKFMLIACTVLPFATVTMLMRGVSLPAVTWSVIVCALACFGATVAAMSVALLPDGLVGRFVAGIGGLGVLGIVFASMLGITQLVISEGSAEAIFGSLVAVIALAVVGFFFNLVTYSLAAQKRGRFNRFYYRPPTAEAMREYERAMVEYRYQTAARQTPPPGTPPHPAQDA